MKKISITEKILKRPVTAIMMSLLVIGFGIFSLLNLKVTLYPSFNIPVMAVSMNYQNVAPDDMLRLVVEPIEAVVMGVEGVESLDSNVRQGGAFLILRLAPGTDIMVTEQRVREAVDRIRSELPTEANEPVIFQFDPDRAPIMRLSVESDVLGLDELRTLSLEFIEPRFERIPGVASAETRGGLNRNIYVDLIPEAMARHRLMPSQVSNAIRTNNVQQPVGNLVADRTSYSIRAESMYTDVEQIRQTIVSLAENGVPVRVRDVANVRDDYEDIDNLVEINGRNSITVEVQKQSDANTLEVAQEVTRTMGEFQASLPSSVTMQVLNNEGQFIEDSVSNLSQSALIALVVVVLILLLFMGGWRIAFVVAMSIPVSLTATFAAMYFLDITLNIISITGLALAIGLLVDNSIVVSESIAIQLEQGEARFKAALTGTNEVGGALLGSTLTTLAVFVPLLGLSGFSGSYAKDLALTISIAITISFLASIILIPVLASLLLKREEFIKKNYTLNWIKSLETNYVSILEWILNRKYVVVVGVLAVFTGAFFLFQNIQKEFFPQTDEGQFDFRIELPAGTKLATTAGKLREYTDRLLESPEVQTVITNIGRSGRSTQTNAGTISVTLVDESEREETTIDIASALQQSISEPDVIIEISNLGGSGGIPMGRGWSGQGIRVSLIGPDIEVLQEYTLRLEQALTDDPNVLSVSNPRSRPMPELIYELDRNRISRTGFTSNDVASELGAQARGSQAGYFREEGREIPIQVRNNRDQFQNRDDLFALELLQYEDQRIPVTGLGQFTAQEGLSTITRRDRETLLDVSILVRGDMAEYQQKVTDLLDHEILLPDGYRYEFSGSVFSQQESNSEIMMVLILALLLTYMVMASLFENLRDPFIVMFSIPLAFFGSLLFLFMTGTSLSVPAYIGIVLLIGIVVNNGIVLVDFIHQKTRGKEDSPDYLALFLEACKRRMRPILLTALTTICSMIPLALELGTGSETWSPLARSVIGGLAFATFLTLFVIPAVVIGISKKRRKSLQKG